MFKPEELDGLEWQQVASHDTESGYRIEITWVLDRFRISVIALHSAFGEGRVIRRVHAWYIRTAVSRANSFLRQFEVRK